MAVAPDTVLAHWSTRIEGLQQSPIEFYSSVQEAVAQRQIPDVTFERIEYREGGAFSGFRLYLRVRRHREVFDVCAAPFGNGSFVSWWLAEVRPTLPILFAALILFGYLVGAGIFASAFGFFRGPILFLFLVPAVLAIVSRLGNQQADDFILSLPLIGMLYERFFRPITYYRIDSALMFQQVVEKAVMEVVDHITSQKGLRTLSEWERKPVMRSFFKK